MKTSVMILVTFLLVAFAGFALAEPTVMIFTADGGARLTTGSLGPNSAQATVNGNATIKWMWLKKDGTVDAGDVKTVYPSSAAGGEAAFPLRAATVQPLPFVFSGSGPDSVYVDVSTATEVIVSW